MSRVGRQLSVESRTQISSYLGTSQLGAPSPQFTLGLEPSTFRFTRPTHLSIQLLSPDDRWLVQRSGC